MSKIIGIDLGTTNSVVAVMEGGEPTVNALRRYDPDGESGVRSNKKIGRAHV